MKTSGLLKELVLVFAVVAAVPGVHAMPIDVWTMCDWDDSSDDCSDPSDPADGGRRMEYLTGKLFPQVEYRLVSDIVHSPRIYSTTNLHMAAFCGRKDIVQKLLVLGADASRRDKWGRTPADVARNNGHKACALLIEQAPQNDDYFIDWPPLHQAVWNMDAKRVRRLLLAGADVNAKTKTGKTPLHMIAWQYDGEEIMRILLDVKGIYANVCDVGGITPLREAIRFGCTEIVRMLLAHGVEVDQASIDFAREFYPNDITLLLEQVRKQRRTEFLVSAEALTKKHGRYGSLLLLDDENNIR